MTTTTKAQHLAFWRTLAQHLEHGTPFMNGLGAAQEKLVDSPWAEVLSAVAGGVSEGRTFSEAMAAHSAVFTPAVQTMVRAGEAGGVLEVIAARIADGIDGGSFPLPGEELSPEDDGPRFWSAFGILMSSGAPVVQALELLRGLVADASFAEAIAEVRQAIFDGENLSTAMKARADVFAPEISAAIGRAELESKVTEVAPRIADALRANDLASLAPPGAETAVAGEEAPVVKLVAYILKDAFEQRASDVHFDATEDGRGLVRYRIDGMLRKMEPLPMGLYGPVVGRLKIMAALNVAERRLPQDGRIMLNISGKRLDLRVSVVPSVFGERVVIRILDRDHVQLDLSKVAPDEPALEKLRELAHRPNGIVICTGPAGSGKTTLMYAMLNDVNRAESCVMTVEDPVEFTIEGVAHIPVRPAIGLTFASAMRSLLRQDPDIIMVGEMRDLESLQIAVQAALTGHLVLTSLHANTAVGAIRRLLDMGLEPFLANSSIAGVVAQRLARKLCAECREEAPVSTYKLPPEAIALLKESPGATFYRAKGCEACRGMGYRGRLAIHEILILDDTVRERVVAEADWASVQQAALAAGMKTMCRDGIDKAARGLTSVEEILRIVPLDAAT